MPDRPALRFLIDMGVPLPITDWLRGRGYDVVHVAALGLASAKDTAIFARAVADARVVVTFDLDFGEIASAWTGSPASLILFRMESYQTIRLIEQLRRALSDGEEALARGAIVVVEYKRHRIRLLRDEQTT